VLSFRLDLPGRKYGTEDQQVSYYQRLTEKLRAMPGVQSVGVASQIPLDQNGWQTSFLVDGQPEPPIGERPSMEVTVASSDYFRAVGIPLLRGRYFTEQDNREHLRNRDTNGLSQGAGWAAGLQVMIVDRQFAQRYWPNEDPLGKRVRLPWGQQPDQNPLLTIVGVVERVKLNRLNDQGGFVQAYLPAAQAPGLGRTVVVKTAIAPETIVAAARQVVLDLDPEQPIYDVRTLTELRNNSLAPERLNLILLGIFAAVALALAVIGLYGVLAYAVTQRRREIGVRMALGAQARDVLGLVVGHGLRLTLVGIALGAMGALALTRLLKTLLFEIKPFDPATFLIVAAMLGGVAVLACWIPARRAARVDPMEALRYE